MATKPHMLQANVFFRARYQSLVYDTPSHLPRARDTQPRPVMARQIVHTITVRVRGDSEELSLDTDESYTLKVGYEVRAFVQMSALLFAHSCGVSRYALAF